MQAAFAINTHKEKARSIHATFQTKISLKIQFRYTQTREAKKSLMVVGGFLRDIGDGEMMGKHACR